MCTTLDFLLFGKRLTATLVDINRIHRVEVISRVLYFKNPQESNKVPQVQKENGGFVRREWETSRTHGALRVAMICSFTSGSGNLTRIFLSKSFSDLSTGMYKKLLDDENCGSMNLISQ